MQLQGQVICRSWRTKRTINTDCFMLTHGISCLELVWANIPYNTNISSNIKIICQICERTTCLLRLQTTSGEKVINLIVSVILLHEKHPLRYLQLTFCRCKIPWLNNDTFAVQSPEHERLINATIPPSDTADLQYDKCHIYVYNSSDPSGVPDGHHYGNASMMLCKEWVYDKSVFLNTFTSDVSSRLKLYNRIRVGENWYREIPRH